MSQRPRPARGERVCERRSARERGWGPASTEEMRQSGMKRLTSCVVALMLAGVSTFATVVVPTEFREVVSGADLIVRGRVTDVRSFVVPGDGIDTVATVAVETVLKGQADTFVSVRVPGGEVGSTKFVMVGAP